MALTWNVAKCSDYEALQEGREWVITNAIIWASMFVGMRAITAENYKEFYYRLHATELLVGTMSMDGDGNDYFITLEEVERRIGLETNANMDSDTKWCKNLMKAYRDKLGM